MTEYGSPLAPFHFELAQDSRMGAGLTRGMPVMVGRKASFWKFWNKEIKWTETEWGLIRGDIAAIRLPLEYGGSKPYDELNRWVQQRARG